MSLNSTDRKILAELQRDAAQSVQDIAEKVSLSVTPTARRIRRLKEAGLIAKQVALLDRDQLGLAVTVFVALRTNEHSPEWLNRFATVIRDFPEIVEIYRMSGDVDYLMKVVIGDLSEYDAVYKRLIETIPLVDVSSSFAMERLKDTTELPLTLV